MFGRTADHAIRAMLLLAREEAPGQFVSADEIAAGTGGPRNYTSKVLNALAKAGLVASSRGPQGGFRIARPAREISVGSIVDLFFTASAAGRCLNGNAPCNPSRPCAAHHRWMSVIDAQRTLLDGTTIADLMDARIAPLVRTRPTALLTNAAYPLSTQDRTHVIR
jgi:Rrf2 family protein